MQPDQELSPHFRLSELTLSQAATRLALNNEPLDHEIENLRRLAQLLEEVRSALGERPVLVSSGYRAPAVNKAVGGAPHSAHEVGRAADFTVPAFGPPHEVCVRIAYGLPDLKRLAFDQLIFERNWVHVAVPELGTPPRREVLTAFFNPGRPTRYARGLLA